MAKRFQISSVFSAVDKVSAPMRKMGASVKRFGKTTTNTFKKVNREAVKTTTIMKGILGAAILQRGLGLVKRGFIGIIDEAAKLQVVNTEFKVLTGSVESASKLVNELRDLTSKTPLQFEAIAKSTKMLLAFEVGTDEVTNTVRMLGDAALGNADKLIRLSRGFGKIRAKGKASMEEINIITDAGVPILGALAKAQGVTIGQLTKMVSMGKITSAVFEKAFKTMTSKGGKFFNGMAEISLTFTGLVSTLKDNILILASNIGSAFLPALSKYAKVISEVAKVGSKWAEANQAVIKGGVEKFITNLVNVLTTLWTIIKAVVKVIQVLNALFGKGWIIALIAAFIWVKKVVIIVKIFTVVMSILNTVMALNPFSLIVIGIIALILMVSLLVKHWDKVKKFFIKLWKTIVKIFLMARDKIFKLLDNKLIAGLALIFFPMVTIPLLIAKNWSFLKDKFFQIINAIKIFFVSTWTSIVSFFKKVMNQLFTLLDNKLIKNVGLIFLPFITIPLLIAKNWSKVITIFSRLKSTLKSFKLGDLKIFSIFKSKKDDDKSAVNSQVATPIGSNAATIRNNITENKSTVDVNFNGAPENVDIIGSGSAPGVTLNLGAN